MTGPIEIPGEKNQITGVFMPAVGEAPSLIILVIKFGNCSH